ncbi:MAG TPA: hypothetical protein VFU43_14105 [Streptosporangiaceae bacterium]|nr:hypothetical protein [Streptosporangiaceae bacterium]
MKPDGSDRSVDSWSLKYAWGMADVDRELLLEKITHTGEAAATPVTLPPTTFVYTQLPNRVDKLGENDGPFIKDRLTTVYNESGGQLDVNYTRADCTIIGGGSVIRGAAKKGAEKAAGNSAKKAARTQQETQQKKMSGALEGRADVVVCDPADPGKTITDIDRVQGGVLWEEKSATWATNIDNWVTGHIRNKFNSYMDARKYLPGYEHAPIGWGFATSNVDPELRSAIESEVGRLRQANPDADIRLEWAP